MAAQETKAVHSSLQQLALCKLQMHSITELDRHSKASSVSRLVAARAMVQPAAEAGHRAANAWS